jgi:hypothetical protein
MDDRDLKTHQLETVVADNLRLKEENARLRQLLAEKGITIPSPPKKDLSLATGLDTHDAGVNEHSTKDVKVGLFRGLFRGREDVYAVRMRFKSGDWGYVPASIRDWKAVLSADAAVRKKVDRKTRKLLSLTDDVLRQHLEGKQTIGVYPLLLDEACWFLAVDFDKKSWQRTPRHSWKRATDWAYRRRWNGRAPETEATFGFFSRAQFLRQPRGSSGA